MYYSPHSNLSPRFLSPNLMSQMQPMAPYNGFHGRHLEVFDPFSLYLWDPFHHEFPFRAPFMMPRPPMMPMPQMGPIGGKTKIEYKETPEAHHFRAELPGVRKEDVKVQVEDCQIVHISAKRSHDVEEKKDNYHHVERGFGEFVSKFKLPPNCKPEQIRSSIDNGVLIVTIPKVQVDKVQQTQGYKNT